MMDAAARQRLRVRRFGLAAATFVIWGAFMLYADALGLYQLQIAGVEIPVGLLIAGMVISKALFLAVFKTGLNLRFADPSMTMPMMLIALVWAVLTAGGLADDRAIAFPAFIVVFMFGIFNLRARSYALVWATAMVGYGWITWLTLPPGADEGRIRVEVMLFFLLAAMLFWVAFFGHYVGRLRAKLHERNDDLHQALSMVEELAIRDDLTGLHNRRFVMDALRREQQRTDRHGIPFSLLVLDIDRFKSINDLHGHLIGDEVLKSFVERLSQAVRGVDVIGSSTDLDDADTIGRFGGEEFIAILPHTDLEGAKRVGERIRASIADAPFETTAGPVPVTVSIGVAQHQRGEAARATLERVDGAMYAAKHAGRNRVATAPVERDGTPMLYQASES